MVAGCGGTADFSVESRVAVDVAAAAIAVVVETLAREVGIEDSGEDE